MAVIAPRRTETGLRLTAPLVALALTASVAGLVWQDAVYGRESAEWAAQCAGQDIANLGIYPALAGAAVLTRRGSLAARLVWTGLLAGSAYTYAIYVFAIHWSRLWLLDVAVLGLSVYALVAAVSTLDPDAVKERFATAPVRFTAGVLLAVAGLFSALWLSIELPALIDGTPPAELADTGLPVNPVHALDLALLLPAALLAGGLLLRRRALGYALAPIVLTTMAAIGTGIVSLMAVSWARGLDSGSPAALAVNAALLALTLVTLSRYLKAG